MEYICAERENRHIRIMNAACKNRDVLTAFQSAVDGNIIVMLSESMLLIPGPVTTADRPSEVFEVQRFYVDRLSIFEQYTSSNF